MVCSNKIFIILFFIFFQHFIYSQKINVNYPAKQKKYILFENACIQDTLKQIFSFKKGDKKYKIANFKTNNSDIACFFNNTKLLSNTFFKFNKRGNNSLIIYYIPSFISNDVGYFSFDIYKNNIKKKSLKFYVKNYTYVFTHKKMEENDTLTVVKNVNCLKNSFMYFPNSGTTTCVQIYNSKKKYFKYCFSTEEIVLIDFSKIPEGVYKLLYKAEFYTINKTLIIK